MAFIPINDTRPFNSYEAIAGETNFTFDWFVFKAEYISVYKNDELLVYLTDYTVPTNAVGQSNGGEIILTTPCDLGDKIVIYRQSDIKRTSGYTESGEFRASAVNVDMNYIISLIQELNFQLQRCVILSPSDADTLPENLVLPKVDTRIGKYLGFDDNGNLTALDSSSIDLFYHWVKVTGATTLAKEIKKAYTTLTAESIIKLPQVADIDDGREIFILNESSSSHNALINRNSTTTTIDGVTDDIILEPGIYKTFVYNHSLLKWFTID